MIDLDSAVRRLAAAGVANPRADAEALAAFATSDADFGALVKRREAREPLERITGVSRFRDLEIAIGPEVFVPRPETLSIVDAAVRWLDSSGVTAPLVVDLCTGSGVIAMAIANESAGARVHAVEIDPAAAARASANSSPFHVTVHCGAAGDALPEYDGQVDLVVANPPYIPLGGRIADPEVRDWDPAPALWAGPDGLDVIRQVESAARRLLRAGGCVIVEHGQTQTAHVKELFSSRPQWHDIEVYPTVDDNYLMATRG